MNLAYYTIVSGRILSKSADSLTDEILTEKWLVTLKVSANSKGLKLVRDLECEGGTFCGLEHATDGRTTWPCDGVGRCRQF